MSGVIAKPEDLALGASLPPGDPHGVSVHLPKWADTVGWASREPRVLDAMTTGYPRFFVARVVHKLAMRLLEIHNAREGTVDGEDAGVGTSGGRLAMLLDTVRHADMCRRMLEEWCLVRTEGERIVDIGVYNVTWDGKITTVGSGEKLTQGGSARKIGDEDIVLLSFPVELALDAKSLWQHTGFGISSRRATHWLDNAPFLSTATPQNSLSPPPDAAQRVGQAKADIKERLATGNSSSTLTVSPSDVFLCPTGMTAIAETADAIKSLRQHTPDSPYRVAVFGFPYVDTYKVLSRVLGFVPTLYNSTLPSLDALEALLATTTIDALFTEFPGNPLLQSPDLTRLHALSRRHNFALVVDDTIGTYASLSLLRACDVLCTSLTKMFSGQCNVMGGAVTLSPASPFYEGLRGVLAARSAEVEGAWFWEDVLVMERNGRDFVERVRRASRNAEAVAGALRRSRVVKEVYYPLGAETQGVYDEYRVEGGGYGYMLSVKFERLEQAVAFYDALDVAKGPSLGTNFTLCCAYTLLAHYKELEWAAEYGVVEDLVRISVGLEDREWLEERVRKALAAAEAVTNGAVVNGAVNGDGPRFSDI